jgi:glutamine synthetase
MVRDGSIDTVIVALTDMQGRLMGKRVQAEAFLKGVVDHGIHFCTYLLGTDMEMNTPDGFKLMNWETGYGDWIGREVWETTRVLPWLEGPPSCSATRSTRPAWRSRSHPGRC